MAMFPNNGVDLTQFDSKPVLSPSYTYKVDLDHNRTAGFVDYEAALRQAITLMLLTERNKWDIYDEYYGIELYDLYGKPAELVMNRLPNRIKECLMQDLRIDSVEVEDMEQYKNQIRCRVICNGNIEVGFEFTP